MAFSGMFPRQWMWLVMFRQTYIRTDRTVSNKHQLMLSNRNQLMRSIRGQTTLVFFLIITNQMLQTIYWNFVPSKMKIQVYKFYFLHCEELKNGWFNHNKRVKMPRLLETRENKEYTCIYSKYMVQNNTFTASIYT